MSMKQWIFFSKIPHNLFTKKKRKSYKISNCYNSQARQFYGFMFKKESENMLESF